MTENIHVTKWKVSAIFTCPYQLARNAHTEQSHNNILSEQNESDCEISKVTHRCGWKDCQEIFTDQDSFRSHISDHAQRGTPTHYCYWKWCTEEFDMIRGLTIHIIRCHTQLDIEDMPFEVTMSNHLYVTEIPQHGRTKQKSAHLRMEEMRVRHRRHRRL